MRKICVSSNNIMMRKIIDYREPNSIKWHLPLESSLRKHERHRRNNISGIGNKRLVTTIGVTRRKVPW